MRCPFCGKFDDKVVDSRAADDGAAIRRRRECLACGRRFTTYEVVELLPLMVIKKDGRREIFDRAKILNGLLKACEKRPVPLETLDALVDRVEKEVSGTAAREVDSRVIGEAVMRQLRDIDQVAYVRFASVYRQFADLMSFADELKSLMNQKEK